MPDITTTQIFSDGEKGITATKMNNIIANSVIQPDFVTAKPSSSTLDPTDQLLEVKGAGTYARITGQQLIDSVSASVTQNITPTIWSVRLRSFNAVGNPTFEVDQKTAGTGVAVTGPCQDRWAASNTLATGRATFVPTYGNVALPGTSFYITDRFLRVTLTTAQASLAASEYIYIGQSVEGPNLRELLGDVHSVSLLVRSSVVGLKFGFTVKDVSAVRTLCKLCTIPSSNVWTLIPLPNLPLWDAGATWNVQPSNVGYSPSIALAVGSTYIAPVADTWQAGNFLAPPGITNFAASAVNSTFDIAFVQHEPGAQCSTPIDCPFTRNYDDCLRYYQKTYSYGTVAGTPTAEGLNGLVAPSAITGAYGPVSFFKPMAKVPTVTLYNHSTGASNSVQDGAGVNHAGATVPFPGLHGFPSIAFTTAVTAANVVYAHYTADTGW
jgi:hypothetical protein